MGMGVGWGIGVLGAERAGSHQPCWSRMGGSAPTPSVRLMGKHQMGSIEYTEDYPSYNSVMVMDCTCCGAAELCSTRGTNVHPAHARPVSPAKTRPNNTGPR